MARHQRTLHPEKSPRDYFGWVLRKWREERGLTLNALARRVSVSGATLQMTEVADRPPTERDALACEKALDAGGEIIAAYREYTKWRDAKEPARKAYIVHGDTSVETAEAASPDVRGWQSGQEGKLGPDLPGGAEMPPHLTAEDVDDDMNRRAFVFDVAVLSAIMRRDSVGGESVRQLLASDLMSEFRSAEDWELTCADHLHGLRTCPPEQVRDALLVDLVAIQRQLRASHGTGDTELQRAVAALSALLANALTRLGEHGSAIHWWRVARAAADRSGDLQLSLLIRATEAGHGLYGQRSPDSVLQLTQNAQRMAGSTPSWGLALVGCTQAKALMLLGRHHEAAGTLATYRDMGISAAQPSGIMPLYWAKGGQLPYAENMVLAGIGDEPGAARASEELSTVANPDYQVSVQVALHGAMCVMVNGGIAEGARQASAALDSVAPQFRSNMIVETGKHLLLAVPREQWQLPPVRDLRAMLTVSPARPRRSQSIEAIQAGGLTDS